jgi:hypothetical protein
MNPGHERETFHVRSFRIEHIKVASTKTGPLLSFGKRKHTFTEKEKKFV